MELQSRKDERIGPIDLKEVMDSLRIIIEPAWSEVGGAVQWNIPVSLPPVLADNHGLLQAFLNLCKNSLRAVQKLAQTFIEHPGCQQAGEGFYRIS